MKRHINPQQLEAWIIRLQENLQKFKEEKNQKKVEEQLSFIRHQYHLLLTITKVLNGKAYFVGCPPIKRVSGGEQSLPQ